MPLLSPSFQEMREVAAQMYFDWLNQQGILEKFTTPSTVESMCYQQGYPTSVHLIIEELLKFLEPYGVVAEAGGTYSLKYELDKLQADWGQKFPVHSSHPSYNFLSKGFRLIEDRLEGGTGMWDPVSQHFVIETAFTQKGLQTDHPDAIDHKYVLYHFEHPRVAIYGVFPQTLIEFTRSYLSSSSITCIVPNAEIQGQLISYSELLPRREQFSDQVRTLDQALHMEFDVLLVADSITYENPLKSILEKFERMLVDQGLVFSTDMSDMETRSGLEPMLFLHPKYKQVSDLLHMNKFLRSTSFTELNSSIDRSLFKYFQKEG